jgi:hypothetical protein
MGSNGPRRYKFRKKNFRWIGHTLRKEDGEIPKAVLLWESSGKQKRRKTKEWLEKIGYKRSGEKLVRTKVPAADRRKWKELVNNPRF